MSNIREVGILIINPDNGKILGANSAACNFFGCSNQEIVKLNVSDLELCDNSSLKDIKQGNSFQIEHKINEEILQLRIDCKLIKTVDQEILSIQILDITDFEKNIINEQDLILTDLNKTREELRKTVEDFNKIIKGTIDALGSTVEIRDSYTYGHQQRVAKLALEIAEELKLPEKKCQQLYMAALVHDIGKIKIPAEILTKPDKLTDLEFEIIKTHSEAGYEILKKIEFPWPIAKIVKQHHEKIDGSGYPDRLTDKEIMLEAKIITVADVVEAMNSHRPYRPTLGLKAALDEINRNKGKLYDERIVEACLAILPDKKDYIFK